MASQMARSETYTTHSGPAYLFDLSSYMARREGETLLLLAMATLEVKNVPWPTSAIANIERCHVSAITKEILLNGSVVFRLTAVLLNDIQHIEHS
ncbi:hypothetical protein AVEN_20867-1 [Araneus ventricosus]|uniref:Uncharacterized protein n=1 Tax=Araneus ventricosus TaxID=182803 RepID=A0A4Y2N8E5_ARAVE|nr:hypothetical protein AVEN_20867-1 [Araneus ventricosus]